jgi:hypothetical protein
MYSILVPTFCLEMVVQLLLHSFSLKADIHNNNIHLGWVTYCHTLVLCSQPALASQPASLPIPTALAYSLAPTQKTKQKLKTFVTLNSSMSCLNILLAGNFLQDIFQVSLDLLSYPYVAFNHLVPINLYLVY